MKKINVVTLCLLFLGFGLIWAGNAWAVIGTEIWTRLHDGFSGNDSAQGTAIDGQGNIIAAGYIRGTTDHGDNALVIKYDPNGDVLLPKYMPLHKPTIPCLFENMTRMEIFFGKDDTLISARLLSRA
jgi:hypothetical protein